MKEGVPAWSQADASKCPGVLSFDSWFNVIVVVDKSKDAASLYLYGKTVTDSQAMKLPKLAAGGLIVGNGFKNVVTMKKLKTVPAAHMSGI